MKHESKVKWMAMWAVKHNCQLTLKGECGFGRECVGILVEDKFPDYRWDDEEYNRIDKNGDVWVPKDAYHKHTCVAVLGRGEESEAQLYEWLKWFDDNGFVLERGNNEPPARGWHPIELIMGKQRYARMVRKA